jgi:Dolichyl-phosphate-mannose-protein mannosyltransferase
MSFVVLILAAYALGGWVPRTCGMNARHERVAYRVLMGCCLCAVLILALGSVSLRAAWWALMPVAAAGAVLAVRDGLKWRAERSAAREPLSWFERIAFGVTAAALALAGISVLAPATSWDACFGHLAIAADYVRVGRIHVSEGNPYTAYPQLMHSLLTMGLFGGGERSAVGMNWLFAALGCVMAYALGNRIAGRRAGLVAAAVLATAPVFMDQAGAASLDLACSAVVLAALGAMVAWRQERHMGWLALAGFLAGNACGIRNTAYIACVLLAVTVACSRSRSWRRAGLCFAAAGLLGAAPWLLRSWLVTGNPTYPLFPFLFSADAIPDQPVSAVMAHESLRGTGLKDLLLFPWRVVMRPEWYDGWSKSPGPMLLLLGLPALFVGGKRCRWLGGFALAGIACLFFYRQYARYYLPFFAPMMVVAAVGACRLKTLKIPVAALLVVWFCYGLALDAAAVHFKVLAAFGVESREDYLTRRVERYPALAWVNRELGPRNEIVLMCDAWLYHVDVPTYSNYHALHRTLEWPLEEQVAWLRERGIRYVFFPRTSVDESHLFQESGLAGMFDAWWRSPYFRVIKTMELDRPRTGGTEIVEIYEVIPEAPNSASGGGSEP